MRTNNTSISTKMNPTNHVLESRYAQLEGGHPLSGLSVSSGTTGEYDFIVYDASLDTLLRCKDVFKLVLLQTLRTINIHVYHQQSFTV